MQGRDMRAQPDLQDPRSRSSSDFELNPEALVRRPEHGAFDALDRGWAVFPVRPGSKEPDCAHGCLDATRSWPKVEETWRRSPSLNVGIATGALSGIVVLDVDMDASKGEDGLASLKALEDVHGPLPPTFTVETPGGGHHKYFCYPPEHPVKNRTNRAAGLDVRGDGGYVVAADSVVGGRPYRVVDRSPVASLPWWLLARMLSNCWGPDPALFSSTSRGPEEPLTTPLSTRMSSSRYRRSTHPGGQPEEKSAPNAENECSDSETTTGNDLADAGDVGNVLEALGRPGVKFKAASTAKFRCLIPGHADNRASANLFRGENDGRWSYRCNTACDVTLTMAELYATVTAGRIVKFGKKDRPTVARWLLRMWHEAGVAPVTVPELDLPADLTPTERRYAEGFALLRALRRHHGDFDYVPFTHGFAAAWCGMSPKSAQRAARKLMACGWLRVKECPPGMRCGLLFDLGPVVLRNPANPYATGILPAVFRDDGTRWDAPAVPLLELLAPAVDLTARHVEGEEGEPGLGQEALPVGPTGVEVEPRAAAVDEVDDLHDVAQMDLAEGVAGRRGLDAAGGATELGDHGGGPFVGWS